MKFIFLSFFVLYALKSADAQCVVDPNVYTNTKISFRVESTSFSPVCKQYRVGSYPENNNFLMWFESTSLDCRTGNIVVRDNLGSIVYDYCYARSLNTNFFSFSRPAKSLIIEFRFNYPSVISTIINWMINGGTTTLGTTTFAVPTTSTISGLVSSTTTSASFQSSTTTTTPALVQNCGTPAITPIDSTLRIIGGREAVPNSWPWQVMLSDGSSLCGGSLINNQWVLTAAHCVEGASVASSFVYLGSHDISLGYEATRKKVYLSKIISHESYDNNYLTNDIALLKLATPVTFNSQISPVCLASAAPPVGTIAVTTGWGQAEFGMPNKLRQVGVTVRQNSMCDSNPLYLSSKQICAGDGKFAQQSFTMDSCSGDSGGPLLQKQGSTYFLSGIVSYGPNGCDGQGVYTNVAAYRDWISNTMSRN